MERSAARQREKATAFRALHERAGAFIMPNPWDAGSAKLLTHLGFEALATTSAGAAFAAGKRDNALGRGQMMEHVAAVAAATPLPVSGDLGNGFGDAPEVVAETIRLAASSGLVGASIEDATLDPSAPIYPLPLAVARIRAAVEAARSLDFPFVLTARAENYLWDREDLDDTIERLQAYEEAGADVLYAPGLVEKSDIAAVVAALRRPLNVLAGIGGMTLGASELAALGVKRISVGGALTRAALGALLAAGREMRERGTFTFADGAPAFGDLSAIFASEP